MGAAGTPLALSRYARHIYLFVNVMVSQRRTGYGRSWVIVKGPGGRFAQSVEILGCSRRQEVVHGAGANG
jgi:hypothetical protein